MNNVSTLNQTQVNEIVVEAKTAAVAASTRYFEEELNSEDRGLCGFAWVNIYGVKGNTRLGRMLKKAGVEQDYTRAFQIWSPGKAYCQNVDCHLAGARAAANVFRKYGFESYAGSRLD